MKYPTHLLKVIETLKRLPGVGNKSAERFAFQMLAWPVEYLEEMAGIIKDIPIQLKACKCCGCLQTEAESCHFCAESRHGTGVLCIVASPRDAFAIEATGEYKGLYHVLGGLLSPLQGIGPDKLNIYTLKERVVFSAIKEIVIALDSTLEGDATALYIKQELEQEGVNISRLAFGLPMGSSLDYVDGGTLGRAFAGRGRF